MSLVCPRSAITFVVQLIVIIAIVVCSLINLSLSSGNHDMWLVLLSGTIGFIFPSPALKKKKEQVSETQV